MVIIDPSAFQNRLASCLADVSVMDSPDAKRSALQDQLRSATTEVGGMEAQVKSAQRQFDELNTTFNKTTGNKLLENAARHLKETQERAKAAKRWVLDLRDALADVGRQEKLSSAATMVAPVAAVGQAKGGSNLFGGLPGLVSSSTDWFASQVGGASEFAQKLGEIAQSQQGQAGPSPAGRTQFYRPADYARSIQQGAFRKGAFRKGDDANVKTSEVATKIFELLKDQFAKAATSTGQPFSSGNRVWRRGEGDCARSCGGWRRCCRF